MISDRRASTPQLAVRVATLGLVAFGIFAVLFLRLWFLQILQGEDYVQRASENRERRVAIAAPRGAIVDKEGRTLVKNRVATSVTIDASTIPEADRAAILQWGSDYGTWAAADSGRRGAQPPRPKPSAALEARERRYATLLGLTYSDIRNRVIDELIQTPYAAIRLRQDVPETLRNFLAEREADYPGLSVQRRYPRSYPDKGLAAQIFGTIGQISPEELGQDRYRGLRQGQIVGKGGLEYQYDDDLRGRDGAERIEVDAQGRPRGRPADLEPVPGNQLKLTIDRDLQERGQQVLTEAVAKSGGLRNKIGQRKGAALVAMDPSSGGILAMASYPSFDANVLARPITQERLERLFSERNGAPQFNRAISANYPLGSTFKPVTAVAALESGLVTPSTVGPGGSCLTFGSAGQEFCNAGKAALQPTNLEQSLTISSDVYYYRLGANLYPRGDGLQRWAKRLGFGRRTGVDLPGEVAGEVPGSAWKRARNREELQCREDEKKKSCGLVADPEVGYLLGNNINLSIGQGDLQATPIQLAQLYGALFNDGKLGQDLRFVRPRLGEQVEDAQGTLVREIEVPRARTVKLPAEWKGPIMKGLLGVTSKEGGTALGTFEGWDQSRWPVYGKTGTAQRIYANGDEEDQAWFAAMVPDEERPIVVAATVEGGGFGAETAAPVVRQVLNQWYGQRSQFRIEQGRD